MRLTMIWLCTLIFASILSGQSYPGDCQGTRYILPIYEDDAIVEESIKFGNSTTADGINRDLEMLVYHNPADTLVDRPVVIMAFGGGFISGQKEDLTDLCRLLAAHGVVAVTIDYRLYNFLTLGLPDVADMQDAAAKAVSDMKAAMKMIRYLAETESRLSMDGNRILVGGVSAGAITAIHTAYVSEDDLASDLGAIIEDNGGLEGNSAWDYTADYSTATGGVLNFSGAIFDLEILDAGEAPLLSMHGTADGTVPYEDGLAANLVPMQGSKLMHDKADEVEIYNLLTTVEGGGHTDIYFADAYEEDRLDFYRARGEFFAHALCGVNVAVQDEQNYAIEIYPNPVAQQLNFKVDGTADIVVLNSAGSIVLKKNAVQSIDVSHLPSDTYFILIEGEQGRSIERFVKM